MYRMDNGEWQSYESPFTLTGYAEGQHTIDCAAVDNAGNVADLTEQVNLNA
jgi:hypothetical protein